MSGILIWAETKNNELRKPALEAIQSAKLIAADNEEIHVVVFYDAEAASQASTTPVSQIHLIKGDNLDTYQSERFTKNLVNIIESTGCTTVIMAATALGRDLSARVAAAIDATLATDVTAITKDDDTITVTRPVYSGKLLADYKLTTPKNVITIRPNTFEAASEGNNPVAINEISAEELDIKAQIQEAIASAQDMLDVTEAEIIISGGRGVGGPEGFEMIEETAKALGGAVGASRTAVDEGWIPYKHQVGQTGKVVTPVLYIACGISGAIQHFAGMGSSKFIIAINSDEEAPIMKKADFAIVGDLFEVLPILKEELVKIIK